MTTHAQETTPQDEAHDHGAPQAGGMSGVAATPGEGARARAREALAVSLRDLADRLEGGGWVMPTGDYLSANDADYAREAAQILAAPAPSSPRAEAPEAEPADAAVQRVSDEDVARAVCAWNQWPTEGGMFRLTLINAQHHDVLVEGMRRALATDRAALRRAAPGAAPEQRDVSVALGKMDEVLRNTTDRVTPVMFLREQLEAVVAFLRATPAPTGERAGGEAERPTFRTRDRACENCGRGLGAHEQQRYCPAPVAAPRGTEGRDDA